MFKLIGGAVVCGFSLYGLVKYLERPPVRVVIKPADAQSAGNAGAGAAAATSQAGEVVSPKTPDSDATSAVA